MRDLNIYRLISVVTTGTLLFHSSGCAGKKEKEGDERPPDKEETLEGLCDVLMECAPDEFYATYDDVEDCLNTASQNYDTNIDEFGEDCGEAFLKFTDCFHKSWSKSCDEDAFYDDCLGEILLVNGSCEL